MNKRILITIGTVVGVGILIVLFVWLSRLYVQVPEPHPGQGTATSTFPTPSPGTNAGDTISVMTKDGRSIQIKDFLKDPETIEDSVNPGHYSLGNHFSDNEPSPPYVIEFIDSTDFFNIGLFQEPIAQSRKDAEQYMMEHLGISQSQMCELQYMVAVPNWVNGFYSSMSLGFSFCPGSVTIPN